MSAVQRHIAPMTGAAWWIVVDEHGSRVEGTPYFDDYEDAQRAAVEALGLVPECLRAVCGYQTGGPCPCSWTPAEVLIEAERAKKETKHAR